MTFSVYEPPGYEERSELPVLWYLTGMHNDDQTFPTQVSTGIQMAAKLGLFMVFPDSGPREVTFKDDHTWRYG